MKTWQVFAVVAAIVGAGWLLFRKRSSAPLVPGSATLPGSTYDNTSTGGPPTSTAYSAMDLFNASQGGQLTSAAVGSAQQTLIDAARAAGLPIATGPATETRTGRGHF